MQSRKIRGRGGNEWVEIVREIRTAMKYLEGGKLLKLSEREAGKLEAMIGKEFVGV